MRAFSSRLTWTGGIATALALLLLAGGAVALAHDDDEDGNTHEETITIDGHRPFLGIITDSHPDGVEVSRVIKDTGAEAAGLEEGDVIVGFNGESLDKEWDLTRRILSSQIGDTVELEILRDGKRMNLSAVLGENEDWVGGLNLGFDIDPGDFDFDFQFDHEQLQEQMERLHEQLGDMRFEFHGEPGARHFFGLRRPLLGVQLVEPTPELREHLGGSPNAGVLVSKVLEDMPAEDAGLRVGDLIVAVGGREVERTGDLTRALREHAGETVDIEIVRDGSPMSLSVFLPEPEEHEHERGRGPRA
jgi:S1-C subfamily serine protease